ncbi:transcriptional regulator with XRE-family HTH domain [Rhodovulum iodosum]|uniref:Transcriptional regulator with XRE-family HTH domain n=1 Tax=Rhodovulum iodosum TaxID=68291 RepID=A0ABV3XVQ7_9RHOB|nr:helix-turn-helix transcriptional regulator [Rhodovulum robiginosum]RSK40768.1 XRE family transcriptional regulator [Rhodovulum robiginosum]
MEGARIRDLRRRLGITQSQLGDQLGVDQGTVSRWERGVENPRPARQSTLRNMLLRDDEQRHLVRSISLVRNDLMPATLLDSRLRLREASASARRHFRDRGCEPSKMIGTGLDRYADMMGFPELADHVRHSGLLCGDALLFRFTINFRGKGHTTVWEPILKDGHLVQVLNYVSCYFAFPANTEVSLEQVDVVSADSDGAMTALHRGTRADLIGALAPLY